VRFKDPAIVNDLANIPEVSRSISLDGEVAEFDFSDAIANPANVFLSEGGGVAMCIWSAPRVYEAHIIFHPESRGRAAINACIAMRDHMMANHADMLWGQPKLTNRAAIWLIRQAGFVCAGHGENPIVGPVQYLTYGSAQCRQ